MHDHHWLYNAPGCPDAIKWSEDNHLAVAAAHSVVILNPGHLNGARGFVVTPGGVSLSPLLVDGIPEDPESSAQLVWAVNMEVKSTDMVRASPTVRSIAWSPTGCTAQAGCLLATVTSDHQVRLYSAPERGLGSEWQEVADLTEMLKAQLREHQWQEVDALATALTCGANNTAQGAAGPEHAPMRLKGGGGLYVSAAHPPAHTSQIAAPHVPAPVLAFNSAAAVQLDPLCGAAEGLDVLRLRGGGRASRKQAAQAQEEEPSPGQVEADAPPRRASPAAPPPVWPQARRSRRAAADSPTARSGPGPSGGAMVDASILFPIGSRVEVMNDEEGLRGCWFSACVCQTHHQWVLVEYEELMEEGQGEGEGQEGDGGQVRLREWFPLQGAKKGEGPRLPVKHGHNWGPGYQIRPEPPQEAQHRGVVPADELCPGSVVEVLVDGGFWGSTVSQAPDAQAGTVRVCLAAANEVVDVPLANIRLPYMWSNSAWYRLVGAADKAARSRSRTPPAAVPASRKAGGKANKTAQPVADESHDQDMETGDGAAKPQADVVETDAAAAAGPNGIRAQPEPATAADGAPVQGTPAAPAAAPSADPFVGLVPGCDMTDPVKVSKLSSQLVMRRFLALRAATPGGAPRYPTGEQLRPTDTKYLSQAVDELVRLHGTALQAHAVDKPGLLLASRTLVREYITRQEIILRDKEEEQAQARKDAGERGEEEAVSPVGSAATGSGIAVGVPFTWAAPGARPRKAGQAQEGPVNQVHLHLQRMAAERRKGAPGRRAKGAGKEGEEEKEEEEVADDSSPEASVHSENTATDDDPTEGKRGRKRKAPAKRAAPRPKSAKKEQEASPEVDVSGASPDTFWGLLAECDMNSEEHVARFSSQLITKRFRALRADVEVPRYKDRESIKGVDKVMLERAIKEMEHLHGSALKAQRADFRIVVRNARALIRHYIMRDEMERRAIESGAPVPVKRPAFPAADAASPRAGPSAAGPSRPPSRVASAIKPVQLPDFDLTATEPNTFSDLVLDVNMANDRALQGAVPNMLFQRFVQLRRELPADSLPTYEPSEHLRPPDTSLLARAQAELGHLYGDRLAGIEQDKKTLSKVRKMIRDRVIGKRPYQRSDMGSLYAPPTQFQFQFSGNRPAYKPDETPEPEALPSASPATGRMSVEEAGPTTGRSRRARKQVKYTEAFPELDGEDSQGDDGRPQRGKGRSGAQGKRGRVSSAGEDSSDEYRVSEDEEFKAKRQGKGQKAASDDGDMSSDEVSLDESGEGDEEGAGAEEEVEGDVVGSDDEATGGSGSDGRGAGRGSGRKGAPGGDMGVRRKAGPSTLVGISQQARSVHPGARQEESWRAVVNFQTGLVPHAYQALPYRVQADGGAQGSAPHYRITFKARRRHMFPLGVGVGSRLCVSRGAAISNAVYDVRAMSLAVLNASWSPVCCEWPTQESTPGPAKRVCMLALGTKAGVLHMWRYDMNQRYRLPRSPRTSDSPAIASGDDDDSDSLGDRLHYCGAMPAHCQPQAFVTASCWLVAASGRGERGELTRPRQALGQDTLLLATGASNGSILLWAAPAHALCGAQDVSPWQLTAVVSPPDQLAVSCLDMTLTESSGTHGGRHLVLAAGKPCGAVMVWRSGPIEAGQGPVTEQALSSGKMWLSSGAHGLQGVTGVCLQPWLHTQAAEGQGQGQGEQWHLLTSTGLDGNVLCWRISDKGMQTCAGPRRFNPASAFNAPKATAAMPASQQPAYGVAASGNGLVMAVVRTTGIHQDEVDQAGPSAKMTWARVASGSVHLYTTFGAPVQEGPVPPCGPLLPLLRRLEPEVTRQWPCAAASWDLAAAVLSAGWEQVHTPQLPAPPTQDANADEEGDEDGDEEAGAVGDTVAAQALRQRGQAVQCLAVIKQVAAGVAVAEQAAALLDAQHTQESGPNGKSPQPLMSISASAWRGLHAATQLRHTVLAYTAASQQLSKSLSALAPLLANPDGSDPPVLSEEEQQHAAARHTLPTWLFDPRTRTALALIEGPTLHLPAALARMQAALTRGEQELIQLHVWRALGGAVTHVPAKIKADTSRGRGQAAASKLEQPSQGVGRAHPSSLAELLPPDASCLLSPSATSGGDGPALWQQLMADWVVALPPGSRQAELLPLALKVAGRAPPTPQHAPCRETSVTMGVPVCMSGPSPVHAARCVCLAFRDGQWQTAVPKPATGAAAPAAAQEAQAQGQREQEDVRAEEVVLELPRCGACMRLCESAASWHCPACKRRYMDAPYIRPEGLPDVPYCVVCSVRLATAAAPNSFLPVPAVQLQPIPPEPIVVT